MNQTKVIKTLNEILELTEEELDRFLPDLKIWHKNSRADLKMVGLDPKDCDSWLEWTDDGKNEYLGTDIIFDEPHE